MNHDVDVEKLRSEFSYDPETGVFRHKNGKYIGTPVGSKDARGYVRFRVQGKMRYAHRLTWLYVHGEMADGLIDHVNGNTSDNRISNLRVCDACENGYNRKLGKNNATGKKGVIWIPRMGKYRVDIKSGKSRRIVGNFESFEEACAARDAAEREFFGEFRRVE